MFTDAETRKHIQYFRKILDLARGQQPVLEDKLEKIITIFEWHRDTGCHLREQFIRHLLELEKSCKKIAADYIKQTKGPPPPPVTDGQAEIQ